MHNPDAPAISAAIDSPLTLRDFLTDGSLARLCAELGHIAGTTIELRDERDRLITADAEGWRIGEPGDGLAPADRARAEPLVVGGTRIGAIVAGPGVTPLDRLLPLIAQTAVEWCHGFLELRHAVDELGVLIELSSLLVGVEDVSRVVERALDSVLRVLALNAGSVVLLPEDTDGVISDDEADLRLAASRGLSDAWLINPESLSRGRVFDQLALDGEVVAIEDLWLDPRVRNDEQVRTEGVRSFMCAGLVFRGKPIGVMRVYSHTPRVFSELDKRLLRSIAQQAAAAVQQSKLIRDRRRDREMERQLRLAANIQRRMLPRVVPDHPLYDIAVHYEPSFEVGGDFYDLFEVGGRLAIAVGDVVGKGVPAAMLMSLVRTSFRAHAEGGGSPAEVLSRVNRDLVRDSLDSEFATMWFGLLDPADGSLACAGAGHEPPMIVRAAGGCDELAIGGLVVGIDADAAYEVQHATLAPGDALVAYTDGATDVMSFGGQRFGKQRLLAMLTQLSEHSGSSSAYDVLGGILRELRQFGGLTVRQDDSTIVVVRRT